MGIKIENMPTGRVQALQSVRPGEGVAQVSADSYEVVQTDNPHWMARLPLVGRSLPFLSLAACGFGSSCSAEAKVGVAAVAAAGVAGLYHFLNQSINKRRMSELALPTQILKCGSPRLSFPRKLDSAAQVIDHYMRKGFDEGVARRIAYAWFFNSTVYVDGIGDLNHYDLQKPDLYGTTKSFPNLADYPFDDRLPGDMEKVACSGYLGLLLNSLDRGIRTVPELANIFFALHLKAYHMNVGNPSNVRVGFEYLLGKFSSRSHLKHEIGERDVGRMLETESMMYRSDNIIVHGITHLLFAGMAVDAYEADQYDNGLKLGFAHVWSARRAFGNSSALAHPVTRARKSIGTVTKDYCDRINRRVYDAWQKSSPETPHPKNSWSASMLPATTAMLKSFTVRPV